MKENAYIILIYFSDHFFQVVILNAKLLTGLLKLILSDVAAAIFVKI